MIELLRDDMASLRHWFKPEEPGPLTGGPHAINTGHGRMWVDRWPEPRILIVDVAQNCLVLGDPSALEPEAIRSLLQGFIAAPPEFAPLLRATFSQMVEWNRVIYTLRQPPVRPHPAGFGVRRLDSKDARHLEALSPASNWVYKTWGSAANLAASGHAWGAFAGERLVSVACVWHLGNKYEEVGVVTEPGFRGLGLSAACTAGLCEAIRARGHIPSWTTSHDNPASQRVAEKVGFTFVRNDLLYVVGIDVPAP